MAQSAAFYQEVKEGKHHREKFQEPEIEKREDSLLLTDAIRIYPEYLRGGESTPEHKLQFPELFTDVKRAWAIWVVANQGYASRLDSTWGYDRKNNTSAKRLHKKRNSFAKEYAERLEETEIENSDALNVIRTRDSKGSFFYCDPPYFNSKMGHYRNYTQQDFENLLKLLSTIKGKFLLSSYPSPLLNKYIKQNNWHTRKIKMPLPMTARYETGKKKTEVLTGNYEL